VASSNGVVRKHLWVTYLIGLLMLGSFGYQALAVSADRNASASAVAAAIEFFEANPDVEVGPRFGAIVGLERVRRVREEERARHQASGIPSLHGRLHSRTQKRYKALEEAAVASVASLPAWRFGVVGRQSPGLNYLAHAFVHEKIASLLVSLGFFLLAGLALETVWGSMLFGLFCVVGCATGAVAYVALHGQTGGAWIGASGWVATLLGAYFIRAFRGFVIPGWVVLPAWVALEYLVARGIWIENWGSAPVRLNLACLAVGALGALAVWLLGVEDRLQDRRREAPDLVANPVVDRALQAKQEGKLGEAFSLLEKELKRSPGNRDAVVAFWDVSVGMGRAAAASPAMLSLIRDLLRRGHSDEAARHWMSLVGSLPDVEVEVAFVVRMGEVLLDEGYPDEAVRVMCRAVDGSSELSSVLASRVVRVGRDLDPDLTRRAAELALGDAQLDPSERAHLQAILDEPTADSAVGGDCSETDRTDAMPPPSEPQPAAPAATREPSRRSESSPDPLQDPHSISADAFEEGSSEGDADSAASQAEMGAWNSPGMIEDLSDELSDDETGVDMDLDALDHERLGQADEDTESEFVMPTQWVGGGGPDDDGDARNGRGPDIDDDTAVELCDQARGLRVRSAVPLSLEEAGIALDVSGSGKIILSYDRIDAISVAAVEGLSERVVIVVDAVLNWVSSPDEPLKTIRFRSDEFNPRALAPAAASAIEALRAMLAEILNRSGATPLPDLDAASGRPFATYPNLGAYQRAVLIADC